ncbi:putative bifunctional diguanylate cyclase/phosphodiesterase [Actibacterium pelagium]|uniref:Diguanylate cyclase n=1 Tax=Actibacterium pelagium TaxID=2029103 RepID=A0A917AA56_9RHOB|nr:bifunctional diguanylate cyclase/phosphodiesterase [Actibacterium pelagium]GGE36735.1 diguanylate cyclase [Actibacterium pelagium]
MPRPLPSDATPFLKFFSVVFGLPQALALIPIVVLSAYWLGGEGALIATTLLVPLVIGMGQFLANGARRYRRHSIDGITGLPLRTSAIDALDDALSGEENVGKTTSCIALTLEGLSDLSGRHGSPAADKAIKLVGERLSAALRDNDTLVRLGGAGFAVALAPLHRADLESLLQICARLQDTVREPIPVDASAAYLSCSVGFCLPHRSPAQTGDAMLAAAETAMREAQANGPGAIRAFSSEMQTAVRKRHNLEDEVARALEQGEIRPWFQPQISTDTGKITGLEALARWPHIDYGMIPPSDFLPAIEQAGLSTRLTEEILRKSFWALRGWDDAGLSVPTVGVNFSSEELNNPKLLDHIKWELDRFDLAPERLTIEVLETVVSDNNSDMISRNISALSDLGCKIDLDDFGTGHASIASIRRFAINRLKIDRSFVSRLDQDREQQNMIAAILTMSERLGLETLAEGVETHGEHTMLAQLGCAHVQGFGIARPMPFDEATKWIREHEANLEQTACIGRQAV